MKIPNPPTGGICPHCLVAYHDEMKNISVTNRNGHFWNVEVRWCPSCMKPNLQLRIENGNGRDGFIVEERSLFYPIGISRSPVPNEVPKGIAADYSEACLTLNLSPKASAALSRRCLQHTLREYAGATQHNLLDAIQHVLNNGGLPVGLQDSLDAIRNIGNFAAHPMKSSSSGEILDVEPGEAEWNLDILEELFDFYFIQPERIKAKRAALNAKLQEIGKPEMKGSQKL